MDTSMKHSAFWDVLREWLTPWRKDRKLWVKMVDLRRLMDFIAKLRKRM